MGTRTTEPGEQSRSPRTAGDAMARRGDSADERRGVRRTSWDPGSDADDRTLEEAGYGYGV